MDTKKLNRQVAELLLASGQTVAVAESCTGGLLGATITSRPGSSAYFPGGIIAYSNEVKTRELGVDPELIDLHGAVSREVAAAMASGVREKFGTHFGIGITGIAGPGGGSGEKPVGTVCISVATESGATTERVCFDGDRATVRDLSCLHALCMLQSCLNRNDRPTVDCEGNRNGQE